MAALDQAWRAESHDLAKRQLHNPVHALAKDHPGAAAGLREGPEQTLTVKRLGLDGTPECTLSSTNPIENLNGLVRRVSGGVRRCRGGTMALRWVAAAVLDAEKGLRRTAHQDAGGGLCRVGVGINQELGLFDLRGGTGRAIGYSDG